MAVYVINRHLVVLLESAESRANRVAHPRARMRYVVSCTCAQKRRPDGHCIHTRALLEDSIEPSRWRDIRAEPMKAPDEPDASPSTSRHARGAVARRREVSQRGG